MSAFWTLRRVTSALGLGPDSDAPLTGVSTDTRAVQRGDLFVALAGQRFDAHDFLAEAVAKGAAAVVVRDAMRATGLGVPAFVVPDTLAALGALGQYRRRAWARPVIAIGGSNGKTSTKELVRAALGARLVVHATHDNLNNQVGVPLTLLALPDDADIAVIEVGTNTPGEISILRDIVQPDLAVVTTVQEEHLEGFGDLAGVMREEAALLDGVGVAVVPAAEQGIIDESSRRARRTICAGLAGTAGGLDAGAADQGGGLFASAYGLHADGHGWLDVDGVRVDVPLHGLHSLRNTMLALAVARECGISLADAAAAISKIDRHDLPQMRSAVEQLGDAILINDAYNSNPGSVRAALELLASVGGGRQRVVVLGTMRELGAQSERAHLEVARAALASGAQLVAGIGEFARALNAVAPGDVRVITGGDLDDMWPRLRDRLAPDAAILLKASRGVRLERLLPQLADWASDQASPYLEG